MATTELTIQERGTMLHCYFQGTSGIELPISIDNKTTLHEIVELLQDEIYMVWDHIYYTAEYHKFKGDLETAINNELTKIKTFIKDKKDKIYNPNLNFNFDEDEFEEYPVAIFTIEFE